MGLEVLLMADVANLGSEGDVLNVSEGYARNYLFPRNLAAVVTGATRKRLEKIRRDREEAVKAEAVASQALAARIEKASFTIAVKTGDEDKMFGSIGPADLEGLLKAQGFEVDKKSIILEEPIKKLGVYDVKIKLPAQIDASMKVWIVEE